MDTDYGGWTEELPNPDGTGLEPRWRETRIDALIAAHGTGLVGQEPIPEFRVVAMRVEQGVRSIRFVQVSGRDGLIEPPIVGLSGQPQHPARHRDGDPVFGQLADERVDRFPGRFAGAK
ncbi:hypothetical protein [Nocardia thailandica]|uniref:hypothetical protein n=1 Tax=Nocardia thailandica TaxID=257275 RepID=UPI000305668E|nr:hypothetical protein [Nocardia thailandica]